MKKVIETEFAPKAIGPYSQAILKNGCLFTSGQMGINPTTGIIDDSTIEGQTEQALKNLKTILNESGGSLSDICKINIYILDMGNFSKINNIYKKYFLPPYPARTCIQVSALPLNGKIEIEAIAHISP